MAGIELVPIRRVLGLTSQEVAGQELPTTWIQHRIVEILRRLFEGRRDQYQWKNDETKTGVLIAGTYALNLAAIEKKPSVVVRRGNMIWEHLGVGQYLESYGQSASRMHTDMRRADMICHCTGRTGLEAECIADIVDSGITYHRFTILKMGAGIHDIRVRGIGQEALVRSDSEVDLAVVPVTLDVQFQQKWLVRPTGAKVFKSILVRPGTDP